MSLMTGIFILLILAVSVAAVILYFRQYKKVAPNEVLVISGRKLHRINAPDGSEKIIGYRFRVGGGAFINPFTERAETMPLEVITVHIKTPEVLTSGGVPILAEAFAQVKIDTNDYPLTLAIEQFLGKGNDEIREVVAVMLEGKMRGVLGSMSVEEISQNRNLFAEKIDQAVENNLAGLGLKMSSFALKDLSDTQGYLDALGRPQIAMVKRDAAVAQAEADRDAAIQSSEAKKEAEIARLKAEGEIAGKVWKNEEMKADSQVSVNSKKAHADMSYELERNKISKALKKEEYEIKLLEKEEIIKLEKLEIERKQKELESTIIKPAQARKIQIQAEAEAESFRISTEAKGKAEAKELETEAEAKQIQLLGESEAIAIAERAKAYGEYNDAALYKLVMDAMPELAKSVAEPLSQIEKIVMIGTDGNLGTSKLTGQVSEILSQLPEVVESLTGVDIKKVFKKKLQDDND